ncbi:MAG: Zn-dependent oligopeptidase [Actinomycetota bacterium]|nr:Zn-dependent oligopeptidase [Actinomycetota bacterium]
MLHDYRQVTPASVEEVTDQALQEAEQVVARVEQHAGPRSFANTTLPLDEVTALLGSAYGRGAFMSRVHGDPEVRRVATEAQERLDKWRVELLFRDELYRALRDYAETEDARRLSGERRRLLEHWLRDFRRAGHDLAPEQRAEVERLRSRLVELEVAFQRNVDDYQDALELTREELDGLPDDYVERLAPGAAPGTYRVSLDYPELFPFLDQARRRDLREELQSKAWNTAVEANRPILEEALEVRGRLARLLGYPSWAHYAMEVKMAQAPEVVEAFYGELLPGLRTKAEPELTAMRQALAAESGDETLQSWDWRYYDTQIRRSQFGIDPNQVAEFFPLAQVFDGMLELTAEVFGLQYRPVPDARAWHPDVLLFEILDDGRPLAHFYADLFPREGKFGHAAAFPLELGRRLPDGSYRRPVSAIVANFTKPSTEQPSLLRHDEVLTLFHEFGHILHQSITRAEFARFSGSETEWDFVEAPSQIMEHWTWNADVLRRFARHYRTGQPIPDELVERLVAARDLNVGVKNLRQCYFGLMDLAFHDEADHKDVEAINRQAYQVTGLPFHEGTFFPASFAHLLGGYDAGYYGYLWSKVYGDDMFSRFEEEGVTSPEVGRAYRREILERGGSEDAEVLLRSFLGRPPSKDAFLRYLGLTTS